ncbi:MAG: hypothetical protein Q8S73_06175 [Deltaproteobacteria bacterium]|nr:hypothetical protein [Myxococcales bacterium]MDP3213670.1 hypothetical protein [Deltaproteobacteria bacterium]
MDPSSASEITRPFSSAEALRFGWRTTLANLTPLITLGAIGAVLAALGRALASPGNGALVIPFLGPGIQVLQIALALAFIRVSLALHDGRPVDLDRPAELLDGLLSYLVTSVLYGIVVTAGFILLIVPGVIWAVQFGVACFVAADAKLDPIEALRESSRLTRGVRWHLLGFGLLLSLVNLVGALAFGVGLFVTVPTTFLAAVYAFRRLQARSTSMALHRHHPDEPAALAAG